ncbi:hypothetical protein DFH09DRAFT_1428144 [Mycena vulgaris]|nr:hypothetical protein DFH09DRAFT_1428144 [Mycena vulgaris]
MTGTIPVCVHLLVVAVVLRSARSPSNRERSIHERLRSRKCSLGCAVSAGRRCGIGTGRMRREQTPWPLCHGCANFLQRARADVAVYASGLQSLVRRRDRVGAPRACVRAGAQAQAVAEAAPIAACSIVRRPLALHRPMI